MAHHVSRLNFIHPIPLQNDVNFARFLADNLATFDYKTQEEVLVLIDRLTAVIAVSGSHLFDILASWTPGAEEEERQKSLKGETLAIRVGAAMRKAIAQDEDDDDDEVSRDPWTSLEYSLRRTLTSTYAASTGARR